MFNNWSKKEKPFLSGTSTSGGAGGFVNSSGLPDLWSMQKNFAYPFTNLSATGHEGPTTSTINSYASGKDYNGFFDSPHRGVQRLVIPTTGTYRIRALGAAGGSGGSYTGGKGVDITVEGTLIGGQKILMVVGQQGSGGSHGCGGGGGTFVYFENDNGWDNYVMTDIIVAAGGGAGANSNHGNGSDALTTILGGYGDPSIGSSAASTGWTRPAPGYAGLYELFNGNGRNYGGGVGAGFFSRRTTMNNIANNGNYSYFQDTGGGFNTGSSGSVSTTNNSNLSGCAFPGNSGRSGDYSSQSSFGNSGGANGFVGAWVGGRGANSQGGNGGFGGGGGGANNCGGSGSGGGFSGGHGAGCNGVAGGAGTYGRTSADGFSGWSVTSSAVASSASHGIIEITRL